MNYEEAFKEAYKRASLRFGTNVANELFLENKESKEERIRRGLIEYFYDWSKTKSHCWGIPVTDIISFLEKQGTSYTKRDVDDAYVEGMAFAKDELEKQSKQKSIDWDKQIKYNPNAPSIIEEKSTWSEEDEKIQNTTISFLSEYAAKGYENAVMCIDWLKSLKQK